LKLPAGAVARGILEREKKWGFYPDKRIADYAIWSSDSGPSVQLEMQKHGVRFQQSVKNRAQMFAQILSRLAGNPAFMADGRTETHPTLFIAEGCENWWRTCPTLVVSDKDPDKGPSKVKNQPDHFYDATCYALMAYLYAYTQEDRDQEQLDEYKERYLEALRESRGGPLDPDFIDPYCS
jgi:hypothetical protein